MSLDNEQNTNIINGVNKTSEDDENHLVDNTTVEMTVKGKSRGKKKNAKSDIKVETKRITRRSCRGIEKINDIKIEQQQQSTLNMKKQKDTTTNGDVEKLISDDKTVISNGQKNNDEIIKEPVDSNEINSSKTQGLRAYRPARRSMLSLSSSSIQNDSYGDADLQTNESSVLEDNQHTKESSTISDCQDHSDDLNNSTSAVEALTKPDDYQEDIINNENLMTESNEPLINKNNMEDQLNINNISTNIKKESVKLTDEINNSPEINENELLKNNEDNSMDNLNDNKLKNSNNNTSKRRGRSRKSKTSQNQLITNFFVSQKTDDSVPGTSREEIYLKQETFVDTTDDFPSEEQNDQLDNEVVKKYPSRSKKRKINNSDETNENIPTSSRKRTRKNTDEVDGKGLSESDTEDVSKKEKDNNDKPYKPRERTRKTPKTTKKSSKNTVKKLTKCGKCEKEFENWEEHNLLDHHLIGWRDGEEQPNLSDVTVLREIKRALDREKNRKRRKYTCDKCPDVVLTSPEGFVSHIRFCGKSEDELLALKWECPLCKRLYNPSSQYAHERSHKLREENAKKNELQSQIDDENDGRCKRTAAKKAATKITEFVDLVKDNKDDNKKTKLNKITMMKEMIPDIMPPIKIPPVLIKTWKSSLEKKNIACCHQFKCKFTADSFDEICRHYSECKLAPVVYFKCKICKDFSGHKFEVEKHIQDDHIKKENNEDSDFVASDNSRVSDDDDDYDYDNDKVTSKSNQHSKIYKPVKTIGRANFLTSIGPVQSKNLHATYTPALQWTMDFEFENYQSSLFQDLKPNKFNIVNDDNLIEKYLPQLKLSMSMKNENNKSSSEWKKWKRFESDIVDKVPSFFTGGPVWAMAWLPIPSILYEDEPNQYLAVSTHPKMEDTYQVSKSYKFKNSIQIWNIGHISMNSSCVLSKPECSYILAHENGTVWSMEWCPSGTYEMNKTMGLLATGSSDGCVHIYSLPFPETLEKTTNNPPVFMSPPVMTLHINQDLENATNRNWQCLKISWSKTNGHNIIAAGFSNGYVALWDLSMKSSLLLSNIKGKTIHLDAFRHFYAHAHAVMHVQIIPIDGERYIATVGMDRETKTWDIEDISAPMDSMKKGVAVNGAYITHWPALFTSYDDALGLGHTQTYMAVVREASLHGEQRVTPLLPTNSPCYGIATSDWANGVCHSTLAGDITALFPGQLLYVKDFDKLSRKRWLVTSIETVDFNKLNGDAKVDDNIDDNVEDNVDATNKKNNKKKDKNNKSKKEYEYGPEYYEECHDKFGIIFKDDLTRSNMKLSPSNRKSAINSDAMNAAPIEQYPFTSINRLAWNSNAWSYLWLAAGYQNGLVRLLSLNTMSMSNTIKKILPAHVKKMSSKKKLNSSESIIDIKNTDSS
ncbi:hypothetical protein HCN44_004322 [Aphidius gifuensis]|uniref:C2H2-type domain-containing protein n=1 Tax=Aphidius gifuensis TaxID=684658 RepID=A0A835CVW9_APHGI|nr:uncharacterized protein LOC122848594 [Aphidius gifuensis]XP_044002709.1 uncharacterized protein LOC122848594 [Aphidius gifuensis]KAF7994850.1 hypothetical protein HCN44_004322 [Aphidius gifuensis]